MVIGAVLMVWFNIVAPAYFQGKTLEKRVHTVD
jgi:hypothetical protein